MSDSVTVATWNVNSVKARLPLVLAWLRDAKPDVAALQEIKTVADAFPREAIEDLGYHVALVGQKTYNGVALLSRHPLEDVAEGLPGDDADPQARYVEARTGGLRVASIYLPNGNPVDSEKYPYKLAWIDRLIAHVRGRLALEEPLVLAGDYNVAPTDDDVYDPPGWRDDALCRSESRLRYRSLINLGLTDAFRAFHDGPGQYTFWDYQAGRWNRDEGLRIDHLLLSPQATDRLEGAGIDRKPRTQPKASDHTPAWCRLRVPATDV